MNPKMNRGNPTQVLNRVLRYMLRYYKFNFCWWSCVSLVSATANVSGTSFPQDLDR